MMQALVALRVIPRRSTTLPFVFENRSFHLGRPTCYGRRNGSRVLAQHFLDLVLLFVAASSSG